MLEKIEACIQQLEKCSDPVARESARELVQSLLEFHGQGLTKMLELAAQEGNQTLIAKMADDALVSQLLLLHGLHPVDLEARVREALDKARPYLQSHGGNVNLVGIHEGRVKLQLQGTCDKCPASAITLRTSIEEAILESAPDVVAIEVV